MSNKRITDLTELTTPTTDDVFPVVDIATNTTTKVQLGNLPVPTAVTTALATKQDTLVSGTNIKTVNSTSLVGSGDVAVQETLVSGTNIKTLNSTSLLGSGDIVLTANPSGVAGAIQFSDGSAFASDATNLFWDDTNNRLGVGTNAPIFPFQVKTTQANANGSIGFTNTSAATIIAFTDTGSAVTQLQFRASSYNFTDCNGMRISQGGYGNVATAMLQVIGSGSTSATTSLLVQNSAGSTSLKVTDDQQVTGFSGAQLQFRLGFTSAGQGISTREGQFSVGLIDSNQSAALRLLTLGTGSAYLDGYTEGTSKAANYPLFIGSRGNNTGVFVTNSTTQENGTQTIFGSAVSDASALVQINSTTRGFLPPRMTTTQKNAISSPASGLMVYDTDTNKLCCYNGSTWNDLF